MFARILIANRGEIACRVIATARRLGIATVAVHSDADAGALHVAMADMAVRIGPAPAAESYLRGDAIVAAALATGAEAIHPGYGFLSENPDFVEMVTRAGLVFIGPPARAIRAMGLKDAAKALMEKAGVPVVPGYHGADQSPGLLAAEAGRIGYPVLIKARAGGGGKGMRLVARPEDFAEALAGARREGQASFGDPACLVEKYVATPRHIEIQVFADAHGNVVHLFERDCSMQRRHQKVIEESPAPGMTESVRAVMGAAAVESARAIGYVGAGTVEFIADGSGPLRPDGFWFMEMNTRLQVEHPVTEAVTGLDLVALQLRVAAGEALPFAQEDLAIDGHAVEARVYAEDPGTGFLPATGRLGHLAFPDGARFAPSPVRVDTGIREGDEIGLHYDPMIAKVIAHGADRREALARLSRALGECRVAGPATNLDFLARLVRHEDFATGRFDTGLIGRSLEALAGAGTPPTEVRAVAMLAALGLLGARPGTDPWERLRGWRLWGEAARGVVVETAGARLEGRVTIGAGGSFSVDVETVGIVPEGPDLFGVTLGGHRSTIRVHRAGARLTIFAGGSSYAFDVPDPFAGSAAADAGGDSVTAPMPGMVTVLAARPGDVIRKGDRLAVLEAMKMEHVLVAPRDGVVAEVLAEPGDQVARDAVLIRLEPGDV